MFCVVIKHALYSIAKLGANGSRRVVLEIAADSIQGARLRALRILGHYWILGNYQRVLGHYRLRACGFPDTMNPDTIGIMDTIGINGNRCSALVEINACIERWLSCIERRLYARIERRLYARIEDGEPTLYARTHRALGWGGDRGWRVQGRWGGP